MALFLRKHSIQFFLLLTFLLSWSLWIPLALDHYSLLPNQLNPGIILAGRLLGTLGPAVAAILVSHLIGGKRAVKDLLSQLKKWRLGWSWYASAGLVFPALLFVVAGIYYLLPGGDPLPTQQVSVANLAVVAVILVISVLGEEIGWRGYALPALQRHWSAWKTSLILGTIHTFWHLPFWIVLGELETFGAGYWLLSWAWILALTTYITWMMNNTGNSLPMALLFHWSFNMVSVGLLSITTVVPAYIIFILLAWMIVFGLLRLYGTERLARLPAGG